MKTFFLIIFSFFLFNICSAQVVVYPAPVTNFAKVSDKFVVSVTQGGVTQQSFVYKTTAGTGATSEWGKESGNSLHFTTFSFGGTVTVTVTKLNSTAASAVVRPWSVLGIGNVASTAQGANRSVTFTLTKNAKVSVEFADDPALSNALMIFGDPVEHAAYVPNTAAANVLVANSSSTGLSLAVVPIGKTTVYFPPGVYSLGLWIIPPTVTQVYIAGGAYIKGYLSRTSFAVRGNTIMINGRGILSGEGYPFHYPAAASDPHSVDWYPLIFLNGGVSDLIEGITLIEATGNNIHTIPDNLTIQNVKINGFRFNNDGMSIGGSGITITNCFIRDNDDAIDGYATSMNLNNTTFWQLQGSMVNLGWAPRNLGGMWNINNCIILHDKAAVSDNDCGFLAGMYNYSSSATATVNNFVISNLYFDTPVIRVLDIRADRNHFNAAINQQPWAVRNISISNVYLNQGSTPSKYPLFYIHGYDVNHPIVNVTLSNIMYNNVRCTVAKLNDSTFVHQHKVTGFVAQ